MKTSIKIVSILMIAMMLIMTTTPVFAKTTDIGVTADTTSIDTTKVKSLAGKILGFLQVIGGIAAVIIVAIFGIKYMMGSLEEKAEYKKSFVPLIVGIVVLYGAVTIANILVNTFQV